MIPIVIGLKDFRARGIGKRVINLLIIRARELKWKRLKVNKIYVYNLASRKMFEDLGFRKTETNLDNRGREYNSFEFVLE